MTLRISLATLVLASLLHPADATADACPAPGYRYEFQGCTLAKNEVFKWADSPFEPTCRQQLEARLFYSYLPYFQAKNTAVRHRTA